jgi:hypothetical protein
MVPAVNPIAVYSGFTRPEARTEYDPPYTAMLIV